jgi:hypothetical protein
LHQLNCIEFNHSFNFLIMIKTITIISKIVFLASISALAFFAFTKADRMLTIYAIGCLGISGIGICSSELSKEALKKAFTLENVSMTVLFMEFIYLLSA